MVHRAGLPTPLQRRNDSSNKKVHGLDRRHPGPNSTQEYLAELEDWQIAQLQKLYRADFELFGYPMEGNTKSDQTFWSHLFARLAIIFRFF